MKQLILRGMSAVVILLSGAAYAESVAVYGGFNTEKDSDYFYAGAIYALNGDVSSSGVMLKGQVGLGEYEYDTVGVPGGKVDADQQRLSVQAGYQWITDGLLLAAYAGLDVQDHNLSPRDPANKVDGDTEGLITHVELETLNSTTYLGFMGNYSTAYESYWARARGGIADGENRLGLEYTMGGNVSHETDKLGVFYMFPVAGKLRLDLTAGYFETDGDSSRGDEDGMYLGLGVVSRF